MPAALPIRTDHSPAALRTLVHRGWPTGSATAGSAPGSWRSQRAPNALADLPREEAARLAGMTGQTLRDGVLRYNEEGPDGLRDRHRPGRPRALGEGQQATLRAWVLRAAPTPSGTAAASGASATCAGWPRTASAWPTPKPACRGWSGASA